jgi:hypothetical protein
VEAGGGVVRMMRSRSRGGAFADARHGSGLGAKNLKPCATARFGNASGH